MTDGSRHPGHDDDVATLRQRIEELERTLDETRDRAQATRRRMEREIDRNARQVRDRERALAQVRTDFARLRHRKVVRIGLALSNVLGEPWRVSRRVADSARAQLRLVLRRSSLGGLSRRRRGPSQEAFLGQLIAGLPPAPSASGRVSVIIEARTHPAMLRACLDALQETDWDDLEIFVAGPNADNIVRTAAQGDQRSPGGRRRIRPVTGGSSEARREALAVATGAMVLFMHDDVHPFEPTWLRRLVAALEQQAGGAVGARLVLPQGAQDRAAGISPLTTASAGLEFVPIAGMPTPQPIGLGTNPLSPDLHGPRACAAVSEACLLIGRSTLDDIGLPPAEPDVAEPVELSLRLRQAALPMRVELDASLWHRHALKERASEATLTQNELSAVHDRWGPSLFRAVLLDRLAGDHAWSSRPLLVGITVTRDEEAAGFGDWYTAHELGDALGRIGWDVKYLERYKDHWYEPEAARCDVVISLLHNFDLSRLPRDTISVAWIRNWTEEWTATEWFDNYDLVLVSSGRSKTLVEQQSAKVAHVFPIATNPERFRPRASVPELETDAVFVGSHWGADRGVDRALPELAAAGLRVAVYGKGWEDAPGVQPLVRGLRRYDEIPELYASAAVAIDDAAVSTKPYGSVNSRVFDALATGTLVVSDNEMGVRELFDDDFPVWSDAADLVTTVTELVRDEPRRSALATRYRDMVLTRHTYDHRAGELRALLEQWARAPKVAAHIGPTTWEIGRTWGDVPFGRDVQRQLEHRGVPTALLVHEEQATAAAIRADIALHIFGVRAPRSVHAQVNALWVISHPDRVTEALCEGYDVVFTASDILREHLQPRLDVPLVSLHQATEPSRFYPDPTGPRHQLLFVGNSRGVQRPIIEDLRDTPWDLAVYGGGWAPDMLHPKHLKGEWVSNDELRTYYSSAEVVLNDHWGDMRDLGIISNRVYDALACGAFVVSDNVPGIIAEFDGAVATYETKEELLELLGRYLGDPGARFEAARRGRAAVLARHTFGIRVEQMLAKLLPLLGERPTRFGDPLVPAPAARVSAPADAPVEQVAAAPPPLAG